MLCPATCQNNPFLFILMVALLSFTAVKVLQSLQPDAVFFQIGVHIDVKTDNKNRSHKKSRIRH